MKTEFFGHPLWQFAEFGVYLVVAAFVAVIANRLFKLWQADLQKRNVAAWRQDALRLGRRPAALLLFLWVLKHSTHVFAASVELTAMLGHAVTVIAVIAVTVAVFAGIELVASRARQRLAPAEQASYLPIIALATNGAKIFAVIIAIIVAAQNIGIEVGGLLTALGISGVAAALAAQETISNFFGCVTLFADRAFQVGDTIKIDTLVGQVEHIGLRSTRLRTADGALATVPNKTLASGIIHNLSHRPARKD